MKVGRRALWKQTLWPVLVLLLGLLMLPAQAAEVDEVTGKRWILPVTNYTSLGCEYGCECKPYHVDGHPGYDLRGSKGTPVVAARSGIVEKYWNKCTQSHINKGTDCSSKGGNYVKIRHQGTEANCYTVYYHMTAAVVKKGDYVEQGDIIGFVGSCGNASGNHVCFEYHNGKDQRTEFVNTIVDQQTAVNYAATYKPSLRVTTKDAKIYDRVKKSLRSEVGVIPEGEEILCTIIQEGYGFVEYGGMKGWVYIPGNTEFLKSAVQLDYYKNEGTGRMSNTTHLCGEEIKLPKNQFTRSGYIFKGWLVFKPYSKEWLYTDGSSYKWWKKDAQDTGWVRAQFADGDTLPGTIDMKTNAQAVVQLWATWSKADAAQYTVRYDPNGGEGVMADSAGTAGVVERISPCAFTKEGSSFVGWTASRQSDGKMLYRTETGSSKWMTAEEGENLTLYQYADGGITTSPTSVNGDVITLHAQWAAAALTLNPENGEAPWYLDVQAGSPLGALPIPRRSGYYFLGWFTEKTGGEQVISLDRQGDWDSLYAQWLPHEARPILDRYVSRPYTGNQYAQALSHLLVASGQQPDETYTAARCYAQLEEAGMVASGGGVQNNEFAASGFLERFAPELTWEERVTAASYEEYVARLAELQAQGYYFLVKLQRSETQSQWCYLYEADGESLLVVCDGMLADAAEICQEITSTNAFLYHGSDFYSERPSMKGVYTAEGSQVQIALDCGMAGLQAGDYDLYAAFYLENGRMAECRQGRVTLDAYLRGSFSLPAVGAFDSCRVFLVDQGMPLCQAIEVQPG